MPKFPNKWELYGGGCAVGRMAKGNKKPCDAEYVNAKTDEHALLMLTRDAYDELPDEISCIRELARRPGVSLERRWWPDEDFDD